jgi:hypothetical protein
MPLNLQWYPTEDELGPLYYSSWLHMMMTYVVISEVFCEEDWFLELEALASRSCRCVDGVQCMLMFAEVFYYNLVYYDFQLAIAVRQYHPDGRVRLSTSSSPA